MSVYLIPLKVISTQALLLLFVIAIESVILRRFLRFSPRKSVEYSMSLNLLSLVIGWLLFFTALALLNDSPALETVETNLINLLFLNGQLPNAFMWIVLVGFITFFMTIFIEVIGFVQLEQLRGERKQVEESHKQRKPKFPLDSRKRDKSERTEAKPTYAILIANAASYSVMLVVLLALQVINPLEDGPLRMLAPPW